MSAPALASSVETKQMWSNGPIRLWSPVRERGCQMPLANGGFGGAYICEGCLVPVAGVYRVSGRVQGLQSWLCATCKAHPKRKRAARATNTSNPHGMA